MFIAFLLHTRLTRAQKNINPVYAIFAPDMGAAIVQTVTITAHKNR
jgi:hypothetical protein